MSTVLLIIGIGFFIAAYRLLLQKPGAATVPIRDIEHEKLKVALEDLSPVWALKKYSIKLDVLSKTWKQEEHAEEERDEKDTVTFKNEEVQSFYIRFIKDNVYVVGNVKKVVLGLLGILDEEGDCPSVVNVIGDVESRLFEKDRRTYDILERTSLRSHSLRTAEEIMKVLKSVPLLTPKGIVAALAHDLGKIPRHKDKLYALGEHAFLSVAVLEKLPGFSEIAYREQVVKAVREHHRVPSDMLSEKLKEADQIARRMELSQNLDDIAAETVKAEAGQKDKVETAAEYANEERKALDPASSGNEAEAADVKAEILGSSGAGEMKEKVEYKEIDVSWLDIDAYLKKLEVCINVYKGGRWDAFSMKNGYVYFQTKALWDAVKDEARLKERRDVLLGDSDEQLRRNILYSVVRRINREKQAIAFELIRDGYSGAFFNVKMASGQLFINRFYVPFKSEIFGPIAVLERRKQGRIRDIEEVIVLSASDREKIV